MKNFDSSFKKSVLHHQIWYFPSRIVFSRCEEKLSKYNFAFFKGFEIPKMAAEVLFEVEAVGRDLGMVRGCHFSNRKTREKSKLYEDNFLNTEKEQWVKESAFSHFWRVFRKRVFFHEKTRKNSEKLESVKKNCPSVKKFVQVLRKNIFPNTWTNFFTLGQIF